MRNDPNKKLRAAIRAESGSGSSALIEQLEPRLLLSADVLPAVLGEGLIAPDSSAIEAEYFSATTGPQAQQQQASHELLIVDTQVANWHEIVNAIDANQSRHFDVLILQPGEDGIARITEAMQGYSNLDAIHIVSHGKQGSLQLGDVWLSADNVTQHSAALRAWGQALTSQGDILIYSCDLTGSADGRFLATTISQLTQADVAASEDRTGHGDLGGDWDLEFHHGRVEAALALNDRAQTHYAGVLPANQRPIHSVPATQIINEDDRLVFSFANGNGISIFDPDAGEASVEVTLVATNGTITLNGEFQVNQTTLQNQKDAAVGIAPDGSFIIVWVSRNQDGDNDGIYGQRYDVLGNALGSEFLIHTTTADKQSEPAVAVDSAGNFIVSWTSKGQDDLDNSEGVYARIFDANAAPLSGEILVNQTTADNQYQSSIAVDSAGNFAVSWTSVGQDDIDGSLGVYVRLFNAAGTPLTGEIAVNQFTTDDQKASAIAMDDAGNFVVAWQSENQDDLDGRAGVYARLFDSSGSPQTAEFRVNQVTADDQNEPSVAMDSDGDFVIAWTSKDQADRKDIFARRYDSAGVAQGNEFLVNTAIAGDQRFSSVATDDAGNFIIAWQSKGQDHPDGKEGIYAQRFDSIGAVQGSEFRVNTTTQQGQKAPSVAMDADGDFVIAWHSKAQDNADGREGVYAQRNLGVGALTFSSGTGIGDTTMTFTGSLDDINRILDGLIFDLTPDFNGSASLQIITNDLGNTGTGPARSDDDTILITVNPVNDAPSLLLPSVQMATEGSNVVFSTGNGNLIQITDVDVGTGNVSVTISASGGVFSLNGPFPGLSFSDGDGTLDETMTFTGMLADINAALDGLTFVPLAHLVGNAFLQISVDDQGNTGSGGPLSVSDIAQLRFNADAVNDAPVIYVPGPQFTGEDSPLDFYDANGNRIYIVDDTESGQIEVTLTVDNGTITLSSVDGAEFQVNSTTLDAQTDPQVAVMPNGGYVVIWVSKGQDNLDNKLGIYGQLFAANGQARGSEFLIHQTTFDDQFEPSVAINASGSFVVAWTSVGQDDADGSDGVYARSFDSNANPLSDEILVSQETLDHQRNPSVAIRANGEFIVAWTSNGQDDPDGKNGVFARRFDALGVALSSEFVINQTTVDDQGQAEIAIDAAGNFAVTWQGRDTNGDGVFVRLFDANATALTGDILVNGVESGNQVSPDIAMTPTGEFVVAWTSDDADRDGVFARRFTAIGAYAGGEFSVNTTTVDDQNAARVAIDDAGNFVVAWVSKDQDGDRNGVYGRRFDGAGVAQSGEFLIYTYTVDDQMSASIGMEADGDFVVVWQSKDNQDGDREGIFAQRMRKTDAITFVVGTGTNDTLVTIRGAVEDINAAFEHLTFTPDLGYTGPASITIDVDDLGNTGSGGPLTDNAVVSITVGDGPIIDLDEDDSGGTYGADYASVFTEDSGAVYIVDTDGSLVDTTSGFLSSLTVTITNWLDGAAESLLVDTSGTGIMANYVAGVLTLSGVDTVAAYQQVLRTIQYNNTSNTPNTTPRVIQFVANDGTNDGNIATATVTIIPNNDAPSVADQAFGIDENAANGASVGFVAASDPESDPLTWSITGGTGATAFTISATTGEITVADSAQLDFETTPVFTLTVEVTDGSLIDTATITINLNDINDAPVVADQAFGIDENVANGTSVGFVAASDPDTDPLTWSITGGTGATAFTINATTGEITVADSAQLDFETTPVFTLTVEVTDGALVDTATITINLNDLNETPTVADQAFGLDENAANGTSVGFVAASDPETDPLTWSITGGTGATAFTINATTGEITVADSAQLDFETTPVFTLTIEVTDGSLIDTATITINLNDLNETPTVADQAFGLDENAANGTSVGFVAASDPETDPLTWSITGGTGATAFTINATTGEISVADSAQLDFETTPVFTLTVEVTDGTLVDTATITINLNDINDAPSVADQAFGIDENVANGTSVGFVAASDPEADPLTWSIAGGTGATAFTINATTGEITVADSAQLDFETTPVFTLTVEVTDGTLVDTATITINLNDINDAPSVADQAFGIDENVANGTSVGFVAASDPDTDPLTWSITGGTGATAFTINATTGEITVADSAQLDFETTPVFTLTVEVTDGALVDTATITINLNDLNETPTVADQAFGLDENAANGTSVGFVAASDPETDPLTWSITGGTGATAFTINAATGEITVADSIQLDFETTPVFTLTIEVTDGSLIDTATITINLNDINDAPAVADQAFGIDENVANGTSVGFVAASDPDTDPLTWSITGGTGATAFTINATTGEITVVDSAQLDFETSPVFTLTIEVTDGSLIDTATITINLNDLNETPTVADQAFGLDENAANGTSVGFVAASDPETDPLTWSITGGTGATAFTINATTGEITVADSAQLDFETTPVFTLTVEVTDGTLVDTATITINLNDINDAPSVADQAFGIDENVANGTSVGFVAASDPDTDPLTWSITGGTGATAFTINATTGEITVADSAQLDFETTPVFTLTVEVTDGALVDTATITINLNDLNETPTVADQAFGLDENAANGTSVGFVAASDPETDPLTWSITGGTGATAFTINATTGEITVADSAQLDFETTPVFTLTIEVTDGSLIDTATITINLNDLNETPTVADQAFGLDENAANGTSVGFVAASDPETDPLTWSITGGTGATAFTINAATGEITVADSIQLDFETTPVFTLTIEVTDGSLIDTATITINLNDINDAPAVADQAFGIDENVANGTSVGFVAASDPDTDPLTWSITGGTGATAFTINATTGEITVVDSAQLDFETSPVFTLTIEVTDGSLIDTATITINLNDLNETPTVTDQAFGLDENAANGTSVGFVAASDPETDPLTWSITGGTGATAFTINATTGEISVADSAQLDFETTPVFTLTVEVTDGTLVDTATITINLNDINDAPSVADQAFGIDENVANGTSVGFVAASDPEADPLTWSIAGGTGATAFTINATTGEITVADSAQLDFETTPVFTLTVEVTDGTLVDTATITINLNDINDAPSVADQAFGIDENVANGTSVGFVAASDPDTDPLTWSITGGTGATAFTINATTGEITVADSAQLDFETTPVFTLTVEVTDGALVDTATITINLNDLNETPTVADQAFGLDENAANGTSVGFVAASDPETDPLTWSITGGTGATAFTINAATGEITVADSIQLDFETTPVFTLTIEVTDGSLIDTATITINLNDINDAPVVADQAFGIDENAANGTSVGFVAASDPEADPLTWGITGGTGATALTINATTGEITVADSSQLDFETTPVLTLTIEVTDGSLIDTATITINLNDLNETPSVADQAFGIDENVTNGASVGFVVGSDPDMDPLSWSITGGTGATAFRIDATTGEITVADSGQLDFEASPVFTLNIEVSDGAITQTATITITLADLNEVPSGFDSIATTGEDTAYVLSLSDFGFSDPDGQSLHHIMFQSQSGNGALLLNGVALSPGQVISVAEIVSGNLVFTPQADDSGNAYLRMEYLVSDGVLVSEQNAILTVDVQPINDAPVGGADALTVDTGRPLQINPSVLLANDVDVENDSLQIISVSAPSFGVLLDNGDGSYTYFAGPGFAGLDRFSYTVSDGNGGMDTVEVSLLVQTVNVDNSSGDGAALNTGTDAINTESDSASSSNDSEEAQGNNAEAESQQSIPRRVLVTLQLIEAPDIQGDRAPAVNLISVNQIENLQTREQTSREFSAFQTLINDFVADKSQKLERFFESKGFDNALTDFIDRMLAKDQTEQTQLQLAIGSAKAGSVLLFATALAWLLRGVAIGASLISSLPIWMRFDPLPVLLSADEKQKNKTESLDAILDNANKQEADQ